MAKFTLVVQFMVIATKGDLFSLYGPYEFSYRKGLFA